jgi:CheY-like chemotaxis protein
MRNVDLGSPRSGQGLVALEAPAPAPEAPRPLGVLVVDDQDYVRFTLGAALRQGGLVVWLAEGGREALGLYRAHPGAIDVVVLDVRMPGMDGPQTLAALRLLNPAVRCCFLSGDFGCHTREDLRAMGALAVLSKPVRFETIARTVRDLAAPSAR